MEAIKTNGCTIYFNEQCYAFLQGKLTPGAYSQIIIITDTNTSQYCLPNFLSQLATELPIEIVEIEAGEANKNIETTIEVWHALTDLGSDRKSIVINLGGGVVTDLGGFAASTFKRGVDFINVPTTLLAMVDASVGGKTGVDLGVLKNQVGLISNPAAVLIDTSFLDTLPQREMRSGLAEMLKHGLIADYAYWNILKDLSGLTIDDLNILIHRSVEIKNSVVLEDPTEKGLRKILNFGHTMGHAIESYFLGNANKTTLLHGEAIAAGMILEAHFSMAKKLLALEKYEEIKQTITSVFETVDFSEEDIAEILKLLVHDKKNVSGNIQFVLLEDTGKAVINQTVENPLIFNAFDDYRK